MIGWDPRTGVATREKLYELDVGWVAEELEKYGKLTKSRQSWRNAVIPYCFVQRLLVYSVLESHDS